MTKKIMIIIESFSSFLLYSTAVHKAEQILILLCVDLIFPFRPPPSYRGKKILFPSEYANTHMRNEDENSKYFIVYNGRSDKLSYFRLQTTFPCRRNTTWLGMLSISPLCDKLPCHSSLHKQLRKKACSFAWSRGSNSNAIVVCGSTKAIEQNPARRTLPVEKTLP